MRSYIPCSVPKFQQTRCVYRHYMLYSVEKSYSCEIMSGICAMKVILYLRSVYTQLNGTGSDRFSGHWKHSRSIFFKISFHLIYSKLRQKFHKVSAAHTDAGMLALVFTVVPCVMYWIFQWCGVMTLSRRVILCLNSWSVEPNIRPQLFRRSCHWLLKLNTTIYISGSVQLTIA